MSQMPNQVRVQPDYLQLQQETFAFNYEPLVPGWEQLVLQYLPGAKPTEFGAPRSPHRLNLWKGMHVRIVHNLEQKYIPTVPFKGYEGYITSVNEIWKKTDKTVADHNLQRPENAALSHKPGFVCPSGCPSCCPDVITFDVELAAQGGRVLQAVEIAHIRPAE